MELILRKAQENEYRAIIHLLASNALPTADIYEKNITLFPDFVAGSPNFRLDDLK